MKDVYIDIGGCVAGRGIRSREKLASCSLPSIHLSALKAFLSVLLSEKKLAKRRLLNPNI